MNRRTKIIVSVAGIFIVLLALLGLTYAYFLTKINGNSNAKSISVTTANLELTYGDGNGAITGNNIIPGTTLTTKEFSVRNDGEDTEYLVVLEDVTIKDSSNNTTTFESNDFTYTLTCTSGCNSVTDEVLPLSNGILVSNSIKKGTTQIYKLTITYNETGIDQSRDMGKSLIAKVNIKDPIAENPYKNNKKSLAYNIINNAQLNKNGTKLISKPLTTPLQEISGLRYGNGIHSEMELTIENVGIGNPAFKQEDVVPCSVYSVTVSDSSLLYNCYWNSSNCGTDIKRGATHCSDLIGKYVNGGEEAYFGTYYVTDCNGEIPVVTTTPERVLSVTPDNYGTSYYYRGLVEDNYLEFNNMCWRIIRIQGDGSAKIALAKEGTCSSITESDTKSALINNAERLSYGYNDDGTFIYKEKQGELYTRLNDWYNSKLKTSESKLKEEEWCLGDRSKKYDGNGQLLTNSESPSWWQYESGKRLSKDKEVTLKCSSGSDKVKGYIGLLIADEVAYAGSVISWYRSTNKRNFIYENAQEVNWTLTLESRIGTDIAFVVDTDGSLANSDDSYNTRSAVRPVVVLLPNVQISSGDGTINNPYIIK